VLNLALPRISIG